MAFAKKCSWAEAAIPRNSPRYHPLRRGIPRGHVTFQIGADHRYGRWYGRSSTARLSTRRLATPPSICYSRRRNERGPERQRESAGPEAKRPKWRARARPRPKEAVALNMIEMVGVG